ncbi:isoleucine--tRNA ligase [Bacteroidia bacterium]|nr:isoleucine--tRNA ligase [Bacteroidia bacterium]MDC1394972.1 isoleucine--tRNA ligase [Bacteroidia bacterium]
MSSKANGNKYQQYKQLDVPSTEKEVLQYWKENNVFKKSVSNRDGAESFVFYEGPPSANGMPGIHHVISRSIKDVFCRYKTLQGYQVNRKAGWDTHGLPVELQVEKKLGITKEDIGKSISVEEYNAACREDVLKFKDKWDELTEKIGYWVDLDDPYVTYENKYIESVWNLLKRLHDKGFLYKGHTIQPFSPAAGTGLSSHELNQPGTYKNVKDTTIVAQFKLSNAASVNLDLGWGATYCIAWTTTPWTLPSNTALGIGPKIDYSTVKTYNQYTFEKITVILASKLVGKYFSEKNAGISLSEYAPGDKAIPFEIVKEIKGTELVGQKYEQLMPYQQPEDGKAFELIAANFVTTEDGTGIVHLAPSFGSDDYIAAKQNGIGSLTLVDRQGKFIDDVGEFSGLFVKNYKDEDESADGYLSTDVKIAIRLKTDNKAFKVEKYEHSYPHCWRTDKPILYYPLESWFVKTTAVKDRLIELNKTINWKPASTGEGRFGNWLENLVDWNLSRSRYWGTPLPIWKTADGEEEKCIGSIAELRDEVLKSVNAGFMPKNVINDDFDLHRPFIDDVILVSSSGKAMQRETDLIDVWFDSGAMPYAQQHYPFENKDQVDNRTNYPADFIAEGVDQTRGWFFTLHAISVMLNDSVAYKNVVANGLILDKNGNKMSKRLGNTIDPFMAVDKYGADVIRWYMLSNASPWDNLKFDLEGLAETQRKFFGTLHNTYGFYALYANIDEFTNDYPIVPIAERQELDRWILSKLHSLAKLVEEAMDDYEPTKATRAIQSYVIDDLSNWYVRLNRRRFWKGELSTDKIAAYQTLSTCLETVAKLMCSFSPFYSDNLFRDLSFSDESIHLQDFPKADEALINVELEKQIEISQRITSLILRIRKLEGIKVRQPLSKVIVPALNDEFAINLKRVEEVIKSEVNIKEIVIIDKNSSVIKKSCKPNFKVLGSKVGKDMKAVTGPIFAFTNDDIALLESGKTIAIEANGNNYEIGIGDIEVKTADIPGWQIISDANYTVALDLELTPELKTEGVARELVNKIQNLRKDKDFEVTDKINVKIEEHVYTTDAIKTFNRYICGEILASEIVLSSVIEGTDTIDVDSNNIKINLSK